MAASESIRILHVDDEPDIRDLTVEMLEREDGPFTVATAASASEALDRLNDSEFECIVSDYDMPGLNGIEFLDRVREKYGNLPFILYTGKGSEEVASDAISAGVTDYLQKQSGTEQYELLANRVRNAVEQTRARSQADKHRRVSTVVRKIDRALVQATSRDEIDQRVCQILADADPYVFAWIGTVDSQTHRVQPQATAGSDDGYLKEITITADDSPTGRGPGGTALRENRVVIAQNIRDDETFHPWREEALERGYRAVAAIPLKHEHTQYGLLAVYADRSDAFDEAERDLLAELGDTIAHAYHRVTIQQEYQDQYRELFEEAPVMFTFTREVDGEPIIDDCNRLFADRLGYTREELRGKQLADVYTEESAEALLAGGGYDRALTGEFIREQRDFVTCDGEVVETLLRATPRRNTDGEIIGTHALFVDITDQTRLQSLEEVRERMEFALEATDSILFELDLDSRQEIRHGPFDRLFGIPPDQVDTAEEFYEQCVHPEDREDLRALQQSETVAESDGTLEYDFRTNPDQGTQRWIHSEAYMVTDQDGTPQRLVGLNTDITGRKRHERELEEMTARLEALFDNSPDIINIHDRTGTILASNERLHEKTGYAPEDVNREMKIWELNQAIEPAEAQGLWREMDPGDRERIEGTYQCRDGSTFPVEIHARCFEIEDERQFIAINRDMSERKRREEALSALHDATRDLMMAVDKQAVAEQAVETARAVLDQPINGCWLHDPDDDVLRPVAMTEEAADIVGDQPTYTGGESLSWQVFTDGELRVYENVRTEPGRLTAETPIRSEIIVPLGEHGVMNIGATEPAKFSEIDISLARIFGQTVTAALSRADREQQLRSQQARLQRQNDRLDEFVSVVSHDVRNPLHVAATRLELASEECDSTHLLKIGDALDRIDTLTEDLLTLAREGSQIDETRPVELAATSEDCWQNVMSDTATLEIDAEQTIRADPNRLKQLLENLMRNAVEHGTEDVTVTIGDLDGGFYVADDGPGISEDERDRIFESGYSTSEDGTGFGLAIVEEIVEAHEWEISVTESADGGARFEIDGVETL